MTASLQSNQAFWKNVKEGRAVMQPCHMIGSRHKVWTCQQRLLVHLAWLFLSYSTYQYYTFPLERVCHKDNWAQRQVSQCIEIYFNCLQVRKAYTITKQRERWTEEEHDRFLQALKRYGRAWRKIEGKLSKHHAYQAVLQNNNVDSLNSEFSNLVLISTKWLFIIIFIFLFSLKPELLFLNKLLYCTFSWTGQSSVATLAI